jgi:hypothetical protein
VTLKAPAFCRWVQVIQVVALAAHGFIITVSPHGSGEQTLASLATAVGFVDVHCVILLHNYSLEKFSALGHEHAIGAHSLITVDHLAMLSDILQCFQKTHAQEIRFLIDLFDCCRDIHFDSFVSF